MNTPPTNKRRPAAILFADIAGYTTMMQADEAQAAVLLRYFQSQLQEKIARFKGRIVNFYGDGALCIFPDSVRAVRCAMSLQSAFGESPVKTDQNRLPVRMGIHYGPVTFEQEHVFGHAINLTSRIESMGVPGAILFSKIVKDQIQDQLDLQLLSLGRFEYKNVEGSLEVFALANKGFPLPRRVDLKGKFKEPVAATAPADKSIAVLPFVNRSGDPKDDYFSDGISEEIIYALSKLKQMKVVGRVSSFSFKNKEQDVTQIGRQLKVQNLLEGSVLKRGNRVRVTTQLVNVQDGFQIWSERFDREMEDIFDIQESIAQGIVEQLELTLLDDRSPSGLVTRQTDNLEAYQLYLKGRQYLDQRSSFQEAIDCYKKAIALDPDYALAYSGLAYVYFYQVLFDFKPPTFFLKAQEAAHKAMQLDPSLGEAYLIDGIVYFYYYWNPTKALEQYRRSYALDPNYDIIRIMAYYYSMLRQHEEAERLAREAVELDPLNLGAQLGLGEILYRASQFNSAIDILEDLLEHFPGNKVANALLGSCYYHAGLTGKAYAFYRGRPIDDQLVLFYALPQFFYHLESGQEEQALQLAERLKDQDPEQWTSPVSISLVYYGLGRMDEAEAYLHQALTERDPLLWIVHSEPTWTTYRNHPRFKAIFEERFIHR